MRFLTLAFLVCCALISTSCTTYEEVVASREALARDISEKEATLKSHRDKNEVDDAAKAQKELNELLAKNKALGGAEKLFGAKFGVGPAILFGGPRDIEKASVENGVVRVTESSTERAALLLETHYFPCICALGEHSRFGHGPMVTLGLESTDSVLNGIGAGWMLGWGSSDSESNTSINVGFGAYLDPNVDRLASGFHNGAAPPSGETQVRLETGSEVYGMVMFSFAWEL